MQFREFAQRVLFGNRLEDKLFSPMDLQDTHPGTAINTPSAPGRPRALTFERKVREGRVSFPTLPDLQRESKRGELLHFFANHELLALELMALALLKFPEAPASFRRGLVKTIGEEQYHLSLYAERMQALGVAFGRIPVNAFFWNCIADMVTPWDYLVRMSLTFEQANLDYAHHFLQAFDQLNDPATQQILRQVFDDEVSHVAFGLKWFRRWKNPQLNDWDAYRQSLSLPLTPARAKGPHWDETIRRTIGFDEHFIRELKLYAHSKGRCPWVYWFNPTCELELAQGSAQVPTSKAVEALSLDLETLPLFLAAQDDAVLLRQQPSHDWLESLQKAGFALPERVLLPEVEADSTHPFRQRKLQGFRPWGWSPKAKQLCEQFDWPEFSPSTPITSGADSWFDKTSHLPILRSLLEESLLEESLADDLCSMRQVARVAQDWQTVLQIVDQFVLEGALPLVLKAPLGASGQNQRKLESQAQWPALIQWIETILRQQGKILIEPWLDKVWEASFHFQVQPDGRFKLLGLTPFFTTTGGRYAGSMLGKWHLWVDEGLKRWWFATHFSDGLNWQDRLGKRLKLRLERHCPANQGIEAVSVDTFVFREPDPSGQQRLRLKPLVEINPRFTMGRVALALEQRIHLGQAGLFLILNQRQLQAGSWASFSKAMQALQADLPLKFHPSSNRLEQGAIALNAPQGCQRFLPVLLVGSSGHPRLRQFSRYS